MLHINENFSWNPWESRIALFMALYALLFFIISYKNRNKPISKPHHERDINYVALCYFVALSVLVTFFEIRYVWDNVPRIGTELILYLYGIVFIPIINRYGL